MHKSKLFIVLAERHKVYSHTVFILFSLVAFVMAYMTGNLTRRLRSSNPKPKLCLTSQLCVVEVVTSNFHEIVLDETKVGWIFTYWAL